MPELEEPDPQSLFNDVTSDEPVEQQVADVVEVPEEPDQPRDEAGRFAKADEPEKVVADTTAEKPAVDDTAPQVPSWRVREINDEKRALADRVAALEAERANWQKPEAKPAEKPAKPDPLLDPEGYEAYIEQKLEDRFLNNQRETSLAQAHRTYKTEFEEAYSAAQKHIDPALKARMQQSRDPGETLMQWHREQKTQAEIGGDLNAYKERLRDEALKDPAFLAKAIAAAREGASTQTRDGRPRIDLAPSLNGVSRTGSTLRADGDVSDADLWNEITA